MCAQLTKYMGTCFFPLSANNNVLMLPSNAARYITKVSLSIGIVTVGNASMKIFMFRKALSASERPFFDTERAFAWVELHTNCSKLIKGFFDVNEYVFFAFAFYDHVIDVNFK
ncbi:hypothetical protein Tco_0221007, partial [Tanacetum coccineum]